MKIHYLEPYSAIFNQRVVEEDCAALVRSATAITDYRAMQAPAALILNANKYRF